MIDRPGLLLSAALLAATVLLCLIPSVPAESEADKHLASERRCGVEGQKLIDAGDYKKAAALLKQCAEKYPKSDWLISVYGEALYKSGRLDEGERQFRRALELNKENELAKKYITEIRQTSDLLEDRETAVIKGQLREATRELSVFILGVWIGGLLTLLSEKIFNWYKGRGFKRSLQRKDYDLSMDILEELLRGHKKTELRKNIKILISQIQDLGRIDQIVKAYIDDDKAGQQILNLVDWRLAEDFIKEIAERLNRIGDEETRGLVKAGYYSVFVLAVHADGKVTPREIRILHGIMTRFNLEEEATSLGQALGVRSLADEASILAADQDQLLSRVREVITDQPELRRLFKAACDIVAVDGQFSDREKDFLIRLADGLGLDAAEAAPWLARVQARTAA